jgi:hypothetical protein
VLAWHVDFSGSFCEYIKIRTSVWEILDQTTSQKVKGNKENPAHQNLQVLENPKERR